MFYDQNIKEKKEKKKKTECKIKYYGLSKKKMWTKRVIATPRDPLSIYILRSKHKRKRKKNKKNVNWNKMGYVTATPRAPVSIYILRSKQKKKKERESKKRNVNWNMMGCQRKPFGFHPAKRNRIWQHCCFILRKYAQIDSDEMGLWTGDERGINLGDEAVWWRYG